MRALSRRELLICSGAELATVAGLGPRAALEEKQIGAIPDRGHALRPRFMERARR